MNKANDANPPSVEAQQYIHNVISAIPAGRAHEQAFVNIQSLIAHLSQQKAIEIATAVIGKNEKVPLKTDDYPIIATAILLGRNEVRAEQRQRLQELIEEQK